jgi:hypothetical protein
LYKVQSAKYIYREEPVMGFHRTAKIASSVIIAVLVAVTSLAACGRDPNAPPPNSILVFVHAPAIADSYYHPNDPSLGAMELVDVCMYNTRYTQPFENYAVARFRLHHTSITAGRIYRVNISTDMVLRRKIPTSQHDCIPVPKGTMQ